ncbi:MAG: tetratricopeptide repeat protein [Spirochaetales bacterium]|nr:tetratricopeptide repeat protein [Spirochaetales bacterium]
MKSRSSCRKITLRALVLTVFAFVLGASMACSSAPPEPQETVARKNLAADYLTYGQNYYQQGNFEQAFRFFQLALEINTSVDNTPGIAVSYDSVASALMAMGRLDEARRLLAEGKEAALRSGKPQLILQNLNEEVQADISEGKLGNASAKLAQVEPFPDNQEGAALYQALGVIQRENHLEAQALSSFQKALSINSSLGLKQEMASNYFMIGSVQAQKGKPELAFSSVHEALELDKNTENSVGIGQDLRALGVLSERLGREAPAWDYLIRSQRVFQAISIKSERLKTIDLLIPLAKKLKKTQDETFYLKMKNDLLPQGLPVNP